MPCLAAQCMCKSERGQHYKIFLILTDYFTDSLKILKCDNSTSLTILPASLPVEFGCHQYFGVGFLALDKKLVKQVCSIIYLGTCANLSSITIGNIHAKFYSIAPTSPKWNGTKLKLFFWQKVVSFCSKGQWKRSYLSARIMLNLLFLSQKVLSLNVGRQNKQTNTQKEKNWHTER